MAVTGNYHSDLYFVLPICYSNTCKQLLAYCGMGGVSTFGVSPGSSIDETFGLLYQMRPLDSGPIMQTCDVELRNLYQVPSKQQ